MNYKVQVNKSHYKFERYVGKARWSSIWHQLDEVIKLNPNKVLEIGPGPGIFKKVASVFNIKVETLDMDPELEPDHIGSVLNLPYEDSIKAFREMARVSGKYIVISLPDVKPVWRYQFHIPKPGVKYLSIPRP